jgi:hypothetical protein
MGAVFLLAQSSNGQGLDRGTAAALGYAPPNQLTACVIGVNCAARATPFRRIRLEWKPPNVGAVLKYEVYRYRAVTGNLITDLKTRVALCGTPATPSCGTSSTTSFVDAEDLPSGVSFTYVVAEFDDRARSGPSNFATITFVD